MYQIWESMKQAVLEEWWTDAMNRWGCSSCTWQNHSYPTNSPTKVWRGNLRVTHPCQPALRLHGRPNEMRPAPAPRNDEADMIAFNYRIVEQTFLCIHIRYRLLTAGKSEGFFPRRKHHSSRLICCILCLRPAYLLFSTIFLGPLRLTDGTRASNGFLTEVCPIALLRRVIGNALVYSVEQS